MSAGSKVLTVRREWPWGLALVTDPGSNEPVPSELDSNGIAAGKSVLATAIQHETDGNAAVEVWVDGGPDGLICTYDGEFTTDSGVVVVGDAGYEQDAPVVVGPGTHRLRVLVDTKDFPERVAFEFSSPVDR